MAVTAQVTIKRHFAANSGAVAASRALTRGIKAAETLARRALAEEMGISQKLVRERLELTTPTAQRLAASLRIRGRRIPLINFGARETARGVSYRLAGGRNFVPGGFIATMKSGHRGVYARRPPSRSRRGMPRSSPGLPIVEQFGPSMALVASRGPTLEAARQRGLDVFTEQLTHELRQMLAAGR